MEILILIILILLAIPFLVGGLLELTIPKCPICGARDWYDKFFGRRCSVCEYEETWKL